MLKIKGISEVRECNLLRLQISSRRSEIYDLLKGIQEFSRYSSVLWRLNAGVFQILYRDRQFTILSQLWSMVLLISYWWQNTLNAHLVALVTTLLFLKLFPSLSISKPIIWFFYFIALLFLLSSSDTLDHIYKNLTKVHT